MLLQCSKCGSVVGVTDFLHTPALLEKLEKKIDSQAQTTNSHIINAINTVNGNLAKLLNAIQVTNNKLLEIEKKVADKK